MIFINGWKVTSRMFWKAGNERFQQFFIKGPSIIGWFRAVFEATVCFHPFLLTVILVQTSSMNALVLSFCLCLQFTWMSLEHFSAEAFFSAKLLNPTSGHSSQSSFHSMFSPIFYSLKLFFSQCRFYHTLPCNFSYTLLFWIVCDVTSCMFLFEYSTHWHSKTAITQVHASCPIHCCYLVRFSNTWPTFSTYISCAFFGGEMWSVQDPFCCKGRFSAPRNLAHLPAKSVHTSVPLTSRKHTTGFIVQSFGECCGSTVLMAACYWPSVP